MMLLSLLSTALACPVLDAELERATAALVAGDRGTAEAALHEAEAAYACAPAGSAQVARTWLVQGALRHLAGEDATPWLAAARALEPGGFDARLGPDLRARFDAAGPSGDASLTLEPALPALLDGGARTTWPTATRAGPHVVQVLGDDGAVRFSRALTLLPGEDALVPTGLAPDFRAVTTLPAAAPGAVEPPRERRSPALLIAAGVAAAAGGGLAGLAFTQDAAMESATTTTALDAAFTRQKTFAYGAYGLWGVAAVGVGLHFAL